MENEAVIDATDPSCKFSLPAAVNAFAKSIRKGIDFCMPACVVGRDDSKSGTVTVLPLIKPLKSPDGEHLERYHSFEVHLWGWQCGGFSTRWPLFTGDTGWIIASDRDTTRLMKGKTARVLEKSVEWEEIIKDYLQTPETQRTHSLLHGFFIPDNWGSYNFDKKTPFWLGHDPTPEDFFMGTSIPLGEGSDGDPYDDKSQFAVIVTNAKNGAKFYLGERSALSEGKACIITIDEGVVKITSYNIPGQTACKMTVSPEGLKLEAGTPNEDGSGVTERLKWTSEKGLEIDATEDIYINILGTTQREDSYGWVSNDEMHGEELWKTLTAGASSLTKKAWLKEIAKREKEIAERKARRIEKEGKVIINGNLYVENSIQAGQYYLGNSRIGSCSDHEKANLRLG